MSSRDSRLAFHEFEMVGAVKSQRCMILMVCFIQTVMSQKIIEITAVDVPVANQLPSLAVGTVSFLKGMKVTNSTKPGFNDTGIFMYLRRENPVGIEDTGIFVMRGAPVPDYPFKTPIRSWGVTGVSVNHTKALYSQGNEFVVIAGNNSLQKGFWHFFRPAYNSTTGSFTWQPGTGTFLSLENADPVITSLAMIDRNYYFAFQQTKNSTFSFGRMDMSGSVQVNLTFIRPYLDFKAISYVPPMSPGRNPIVDEAFMISQWVVSIDRDGYVFFVNFVTPQLLTFRVPQPFTASFTKVDSSRLCNSTNCEIVVVEMRSANSVWLSKLRVVTSTTPPTATVYATLDITSIGAANRPVQLGYSPVFIVPGSSRFYSYKQLGNGFFPVASSIFSSPTYTNMEPGSLVAGELNQSTYPDSFLMMAMFIKNTTTGAREARMLVLKGKCDQAGQDLCIICEPNTYQAPNGTCITCQVANCLECPSNPTCSRCKTGFLSIQNICLTCPTNVSSNAVFISSTGPICVNRSSSPYNQGYGVVVSQVDYRLIQTCQDVGCRSCPENKDICSNCKPDHLFVLNKCILCPVNSSNAILNESGAIICVDRTSSLYSQGYGLMASQLSYQQIERCKVSNCQTCYQNSVICTACRSGFVLSTNQCISCPQTFKYAILVSNQSLCVDRTILPYVQGYGVDQAETNFRLIAPCAIKGCQNCFENYKNCTGCLADHILFLSRCTLCPSDGRNAMVVQNQQPFCVDRTSPAYESGFGLELTNPGFPLINTCQVSGCVKCSNNRATCEKCIHPQGTGDQAQGTIYSVCVQPKQPTTSAAGTATKQGAGSSSFLVSRLVAQNFIKIVFAGPAQDPNLKIEVRDLVELVTYSGAEVGAQARWSTDNVLDINFESPVSVLKGELLVYLPGDSPQVGTLNIVSDSRTRLLAGTLPEGRLIVVGDFVLMQSGWFGPLRTITQVVFWLFRTVGSFLLFGRYPYLSMLCDYFINLCLVLSAFGRDILPAIDIPLQIIGHTKLLWVWVESPFLLWTSSALGCKADAGFAVRGFMCSFLDNVGSLLVGLSAMCIFSLIAILISRLIKAKSKNTWLRGIADSILSNYGLSWFFAKVGASHIEIFLSAVISYSLADSSSKSVVGIIVASLILIAYGFWAFKLTKSRLGEFASGRRNLYLLPSASTERGLPQNTHPDVDRPAPTQQQQLNPVQEPRSALVLGALSLWRGVTAPADKLDCFRSVALFLRSLLLCILVITSNIDSSAAFVVSTLLALLIQMGYLAFGWRNGKLMTTLEPSSQNLTECFALIALSFKMLIYIAKPSSHGVFQYLMLSVTCLVAAAILALQILGLIKLCKPKSTGNINSGHELALRPSGPTQQLRSTGSTNYPPSPEEHSPGVFGDSPVSTQRQGNSFQFEYK